MYCRLGNVAQSHRIDYFHCLSRKECNSSLKSLCYNFHTSKIHAHYFEDGNVQLQSARGFPDTEIKYSTDAGLTTAIIAHIKVSLQSTLH